MDHKLIVKSSDCILVKIFTNYINYVLLSHKREKTQSKKFTKP